MGERTPGWWLTRFELALGIVVTLFAGWVVLSLTPQTCFGCYVGWPLPVWPGFIPMIALLGMVAGLAWMIRIFRGPRDDPPSWRYRDR